MDKHKKYKYVTIFTTILTTNVRCSMGYVDVTLLALYGIITDKKENYGSVMYQLIQNAKSNLGESAKNAKFNYVYTYKIKDNGYKEMAEKLTNIFFKHQKATKTFHPFYKITNYEKCIEDLTKRLESSSFPYYQLISSEMLHPKDFLS